MQEGCRASPEEIHFKSSVQNDDDDDAVPTGLHARGIYGGLLVSQGLYAAFLSFQISDARGSRSEEAEADPILDPTLSEYAFLCNSCHAYFLSPGRATLPVLYSVATLRRGKNFIVKQIQAYQRSDPASEAAFKGTLIFTTNASFKRPEKESVNSFTAPTSIPATDAESLSTYADALRKWAESENIPDSTKAAILKKIRNVPLIEERPDKPFDAADILKKAPILPPVHNMWVRTHDRFQGIPSEPFCQIIMALLSDHVLFASLLPYGYHQVLGDPEIEFMTSLDHSLYFHSAATDASHYLDPLQPFFNAHQIFDPSQWHLFQIQCSHVSHQLAQVDGKLMNKQGFLFMQVTQQGLVRLKSSKL